MASPLDLASFGGFNCFGIESNDICDDAGAVVLLQMCKKRSREEGVYMLVSQCGTFTTTCVGSLFGFDIFASSPFSS